MKTGGQIPIEKHYHSLVDLQYPGLMKVKWGTIGRMPNIYGNLPMARRRLLARRRLPNRKGVCPGIEHIAQM